MADGWLQGMWGRLYDERPTMHDRFHSALVLAFLTGLVNQELLLRNEIPDGREPHPQSPPPAPAPAVGCGAIHLGRDREAALAGAESVPELLYPGSQAIAASTGETMIPTYSHDHARSGSDISTASTAPLRVATSQLQAVTILCCAILMRFRGPSARKGHFTLNRDTASVACAGAADQHLTVIGLYRPPDE